MTLLNAPGRHFELILGEVQVPLDFHGWQLDVQVSPAAGSMQVSFQDGLWEGNWTGWGAESCCPDSTVWAAPQRSLLPSQCPLPQAKLWPGTCMLFSRRCHPPQSQNESPAAMGTSGQLHLYTQRCELQSHSWGLHLPSGWQGWEQGAQPRGEQSGASLLLSRPFSAHSASMGSCCCSSRLPTTQNTLQYSWGGKLDFFFWEAQNVHWLLNGRSEFLLGRTRTEGSAEQPNSQYFILVQLDRNNNNNKKSWQKCV